MPEKMRFYVEEQLSEHMAETPEGFLLCLGVPITRTGEFLYKANEVPVEADRSGMITIKRFEEDVFDEKAMKSFEGKPVTINHPSGFVGPENWAGLAHGHLQNVRRGDREQKDMLVADMLITTAEAIELVKSGLREVSCGYDAEYEQLEEGVGKQKDIVGNHVALVMKGRAGSRCAIGDTGKICDGCGNCSCGKENNVEEVNMGIKELKKKLRVWIDSMPTADQDLEDNPKANREDAKIRKESADKKGKAKDDEEETGTDIEKKKKGESEDTGEAAAMVAEAKTGAALTVKDDDDEEDNKDLKEDEKGKGLKAKDKKAKDKDEDEDEDEETIDAEDPAAVKKLKNDVEKAAILALDNDGDDDEDDKKDLKEQVKDLRRAIKDMAASQKKFQDGVAKVIKDAEAAEEAEAEKETKEKNETADCDATWNETAHAAEILFPGMHLRKPTKDHGSRMREIKITALRGASLRPDSKDVVEKIVKGRAFSKMTNDALDVAFTGAAELLSALNNGKVGRGSIAIETKDFGSLSKIQEIEKANKKFYKTHGHV
jgi:hypothetical protein